MTMSREFVSFFGYQKLPKVLEELRLSEKGRLSLFCIIKAAISIAQNPIQLD